MVSTRSNTFSVRVSSAIRPPSPLYMWLRLNAEASTCSGVASGSRSPASSSTVSRSKGTFRFSAPTSQSRQGHMERVGSAW